VVGIDVRHLGDYIREQRSASDISLRQLAKLAGVSNPYLSQIERGLRKPSAEILQQIAKALRISAEALYVQAGILEQREGNGVVIDAVLSDEGLNERQKQVLLEIYDSFRKENAASPPEATPPAGDDVAVTVVTAEPVSTAGMTAAATRSAKAAKAAPAAPTPTTTRAKAGGKRRAPATPEPGSPAPGA
jgi:transcriptional regulator with XRE-family HTH domain